VYLAPIAWAVQMAANYALGPVSCHQQTRLYFWAISLIGIAASAFTGWKGWTAWESVRHASPADRDADSEKFVAIAAVGLGALCCLLIFAQMIPTFFFHPCQ
jgi:hypothetical protein